MTKYILIFLSALTLGIMSGYGVTLTYYGHEIATAMFLLQEEEIIMMEEAAHEAYLKEPPAVAVWALENYVNTMDRLKKERSSVATDNPFLVLTPDDSLVLAHARLCILNENLSKYAKSRYHLEAAVAHIPAAGLPGIANQADLIRLMKEMDRRYRGPEQRIAQE